MSKQEVFTCDYCELTEKIPTDGYYELPIGWVTLRIMKEIESGTDDIAVHAHACEDCATGANAVHSGIVPFSLKDKVYPPPKSKKKAMAKLKQPRVFKHPMKYNKKANDIAEERDYED